MQKPLSVESLEKLGRERLSKSFFMRDFLYSEIANHYGIPNIPNDLDLAIEAGKLLCEELLEPLQATFGRLAIRSAYRSRAVNDLGNEKKHNCASSDSNRAAHIWDECDACRPTLSWQASTKAGLYGKRHNSFKFKSC